LPQSFSELESKLEILSHCASLAHLDVCDGKFSSAASWPYHPEDKEVFSAIAREEKGMPFWEQVDFEVHLMIAHPEKEIDQWIHAGATRIVVHVESVFDFDKLKEVTAGRVELGVSLRHDTSLDAIVEHQKLFSFIQLMTIVDIGGQGIPFDQRAYARIRDTHTRFSDFPISVDGGVNLENAKLLIDAGASRLVVGSAIISADDPFGAYASFTKIANGYGA